MNNFYTCLNQEELGQRIKSVRKTHNMTVEKFAEILMVSEQAVYKWQRGQSAPDLMNIVQISERFNVSTDYLLKGRRGDSDELAPLPIYAYFSNCA